MRGLVVLLGLYLPGVAGQVFGATLTASPAAVNYGNLTVNSSLTQNVTLTNQGSGTQISSLRLRGVQASSFQVSGITLPLWLAGGKSVTFQVKFMPSSAGAFSATLNVFLRNFNRLNVPLSGTAGSATQGMLTISPSALSFGNVGVGAVASQTVSLSASAAAIQITNATTTNQEFTISGLTLPATIAAGTTLTVTVNFQPTASGATSTQLSLTDNATSSPGVISATGAGVAKQQHTVGLVWTPSQSSVAGYNVYRGTQTGGPYSKLNGGAIVTTSYSDATIASGGTYFYVTTAVAASGAESLGSNEVKTLIPTP
jgi:hypothetical protein